MSDKRALGPLRGESLYVRQSGGVHRYGHVVLTIESARSEGLSFAWDVSPDQIPSPFKAAVLRGIQKAPPLIGRGSEGLLVRITGGSFHETDSNGLSFEVAAAQAIESALKSTAG